MSWQDVSPEAVLREIRAGKTTRVQLAAAFDVHRNSMMLHDAIERLVADGEIAEHGAQLLIHDRPADLRAYDDDLEDYR